MTAIIAAIDQASPGQLIELVRLALDRARALGFVAQLADAIDATLKAAKTPTEDLHLAPTEPAPTAPPPSAGSDRAP